MRKEPAIVLYTYIVFIAPTKMIGFEIKMFFYSQLCSFSILRSIDIDRGPLSLVSGRWMSYLVRAVSIVLLYSRGSQGGN